ncbi:MAG TPA: 5-dehydro-4-deoxyglucarate dehydratase [Mycobacteriales bacterium]
MISLDGVLFFPVTPFDDKLAVDVGSLAAHVERGVAAGPGAVFAAGGTGEFHALAPDEHRTVVATAVDATAGRVPVFAGAGGPLPVAVEQVRAASDVGADGVLLLPPYLVEAPGAGLVAYCAAVTEATDLPVIVYHRANAVFDPVSAAALADLPTVIGLKDGLGDLDLLTRIMAAIRARLGPSGRTFQFFNGLPTAELTAPAYAGLGVRLYSSAVFCFAPQISHAFARALATDDTEAVRGLLDDFFVPLVALRRQVPGYAVSLVKAATRLQGQPVGGVRPPLVDPSAEHLDELRRIIDAGTALTESLARR